MAHIQTAHLKLWKPQDLNVDKISSQKMFIDNIDALDNFAKATMQKLHTSVQNLVALKAINTSDTSIFTNGTLVMVASNGIYYFDRSSVEVDNGTTIIAPTTGGGRWKSISVLTNINDLSNILSISKGGTGGSSRAESINNLFASGADIFDANTVLDNGTYVAVPNMTANIPTNNYGLLIVFKNIAYYYIQIFVPINAVDMWIRTKVTTSAWSGWKKIASTDILPATVE